MQQKPTYQRLHKSQTCGFWKTESEASSVFPHSSYEVYYLCQCLILTCKGLGFET